MSEETFVNVIIDNLKKRLGDEASIKARTVKKNNNVVYRGIIIQKRHQNIAPTIYVNSFFELYKKGETLDTIVDCIEQQYYKGEVKQSIDMEFFRDFSEVKSRIAYRLINAKKNEELLEEIPHILFMDLAICFYYAFQSEELGDGMILVHNTHMEMWNTSHKELMNLAQENTERLFPAVFESMGTILKEFGVDGDDYPMIYVLTNQQKCQGAATILYKDMLDNIASRIGGNYYLLPSSIHEVIILKEETCQVDSLHNMIVEANETQVMEEEVLADYPYYYDASKKKLTRIDDPN